MPVELDFYEADYADENGQIGETVAVENIDFIYELNKLISPDKISNEVYHLVDGISASGLKMAWLDPKLYDNKDALMRIPSPALDIGTAVHEALLEPAKFDIDNYDLSKTHIKKLEVMINNGKVMFDYILSKTKNELSLFVQDEGFVRKVRADAYDIEKGIIYDVKTSRYSSPNKFIKDAFELGYHLQASWYLDTFRLAGYKADYFAFLVVPSESPCQPFAVQITDRFIEDGRGTYTEVVENVMNYKESNKSVFFRVMDLPEWRLKQLGETE